MNKRWISAAAACTIVPMVTLAQHGGHGSMFGGGHDERAPARPRRYTPPPEPPPRPAEIYVLVDEKGFSPREFQVKSGEATEIIVMRTTDATCAKELVVPDLGIQVALPLEQPVRFTLSPSKPRRIHFSCAEGHVDGDIVVQ
jgi:hypothetical protein